MIVMKKSLVNLLVLVLVFALMFPCNIVVFANTEPDNPVLANGENNTPIFTTEAPTDFIDTMIGKTYIVNTGNYENLIVKEHDLILGAHELMRTTKCVFNEDDVCEVDITYETDFNIYIGSELVYTSYFNNIKNKYISTQTFTVFNTLEEALNDDGEPVTIETEPKETETTTETTPSFEDTMIGKTHIVNTGNHKNLTVKLYERITSSKSHSFTYDCEFDENNIYEAKIFYEYDFNIYSGSQLLFTAYSPNVYERYISTKTFTVFNTLEEALNDNGEPVIIETEPSETEPSENKTKITLKKSKATLYLKGTTKIKATVKNAKGKTTYKSSNNKIAKVNSNGKVIAKKVGTAKITVNNNGVKKYFKVVVKKPKLNSTKKNLKVKKSFRLKITGKVGKATFISSNKKIATVNYKGKIVAKKKGNAVIKVKTNGIVLRCKVNVK